MGETKWALVVLLAAFFGLLGGFIGGYSILKFYEPSEEKVIADWYDAENAVHVSPHSIRKAMDKNEDTFILVDLRSQQEYEKEHIIGAVSIPAYSDPDTSAYGDVVRIANSFKELKEKNPNKNIVVYCYSIPCMTGRKIGKMLSENGIFVKHLGIGWNEWRYYWNLWNHEHEWSKTNVVDYIAAGKEPGRPILKINSTSCAIEGQFGC